MCACWFRLAIDANARHSNPVDFSAVLFDFDGVLVDTEWAIYKAWQRTFQANGHELPLEIYTRCIGSDFETWSPKTHLEELTGSSFDWHQLDAQRQTEIRNDLDQAGPMPGVLDLLEDLASQKVRLAVVSSSHHGWVDDWLDQLKLTPYFETVVCRGDAKRIKPAPDLWIEALRRLDLPSSSCVAIEDSLNGVKSAKAAGLAVWAVPNRTTACLDFAAADRVLPSLRHFRAQADA